MTYIDAQLAEDFAYERCRNVFAASRWFGPSADEREAYKDFVEAFAARTLMLQSAGAELWFAVSSRFDSKADVRRRLEAALDRRRAFGAAAESLSE